MYRKTKRAILTAIKYLCIVMLLVMCLVVLAGVLCRFWLKFPLIWAEELALTCMVWVTFLGTALAYELNSHVVVDFMVDLLRGKNMKKTLLYIKVFTNLLTVVLFFVMTTSGYTMMLKTKTSITAGLNIPVATLYASAFIGGIIMTWLGSERLFYSIWSLFAENEIVMPPEISPPYKSKSAG